MARDQLEVGVDRQVGVGERLRLDALRGVDDQQRALARGERARDLVGEVDVAGRVDQVQLVGLAVVGVVADAHRLRLDRDAALALQVHRSRAAAPASRASSTVLRQLEDAVGQRRLAVVDVGDDREVADVVLVGHGPLQRRCRGVTRGERAFVEFFGNARNRVSPGVTVLDVLERTGAHWGGSYPAGRRPRAVRDGDRMFQARLVALAGGAGDIVVFGRGTAPDTSRAATTRARKTSRAVRGADGGRTTSASATASSSPGRSASVSLGELMDALGAEAFASTQQNALAGSGNVDPRQAYRQQPAVRLSHEGREWLDARLDEAFAHAGRLSAAELAGLDWPKKTRRTKAPGGPKTNSSTPARGSPTIGSAEVADGFGN